MKENITFLGRGTFSQDAYGLGAEKFGATAIKKDFSNCVSADKNDDVIPMILEHGGYGALAMETKKEGRYELLVKAFIKLLEKYSHFDCPIQVIGAIRMKIHFALMVRSGIQIGDITEFLGHGKAYAPCAKHIGACGVPFREVDNNGLAAEMVATKEEFASAAALAPLWAARMYGLEVLCPEFEDGEAITTFFIIGPKTHVPVTGEKNRALLVFDLKDQPGSLVDVLLPFKTEGLNLRQPPYSIHVRDNIYHMAMEIECEERQLQAFERAKSAFVAHVEKYICFGPFAVVS